MKYEICGVEFENFRRYKAVKNAVESSKIEGFKPTHQSIQNIKDLFRRKING